VASQYLQTPRAAFDSGVELYPPLFLIRGPGTTAAGEANKQNGVLQLALGFSTGERGGLARNSSSARVGYSPSQTGTICTASRVKQNHLPPPGCWRPERMPSRQSKPLATYRRETQNASFVRPFIAAAGIPGREGTRAYPPTFPAWPTTPRSPPNPSRDKQHRVSGNQNALG